MRTLTCMVVDDEPLAVKLLESFVNKTPDLQLVASFTDSVEAISAIKSQPVDLLFLDIQMPDMNGMELAHIVPPETKIIFATAFKEYAYESYEVSALDFLLKPIRYNKFLTAVEKARQWYDRMETEPEKNSSHQDDTIFIKVDGEFRQIPVASILYVSGMKDYVMFWIEGERKALITHMTMKAVEDMLPAAQFMRVHRSYIVALNKIRSIDRNDCIYIGEEIIHVPEGYQQAFHTFIETRSF